MEMLRRQRRLKVLQKGAGAGGNGEFVTRRKSIVMRLIFHRALPDVLLVLGGRTDGGAPTRPSLALEYSGVERTVEELKSALREHQPDGIVGTCVW
jgi:hypothetical protein